MFGVGEVRGTDFAFEKADGVVDFVDFGVGFVDGGFGDRFRDLLGGEFAEDALFAEAGAIAAGGCEGVGVVAVVEDAHFLELGERFGDVGFEGGLGGEFTFEFSDRQGAAGEQAKRIVPQRFGVVLFPRAWRHLPILATQRT